MQAGLSARPFLPLPLGPNLAVTLAMVGAPSVTSQAPVKKASAFFRDQVSDPLCVCCALRRTVLLVFSTRCSSTRTLRHFTLSDKLIRATRRKIYLFQDFLCHELVVHRLNVEYEHLKVSYYAQFTLPLLSNTTVCL